MSIDAHPTIPEFEYVKPESLADASKFLAEHFGEARPLNGGTDIFVRMRDGAWKDKYLVDIKGLEGVCDISFDPQSGLTIGAAVSNNQVSAHPDVRQYYKVLADACDSCASYQLRSRATVVGNICNASPAGDTLGASLLLGGILNVHGVDGVRQEPLTGFFTGPGKNVLNPGDIVTSIFFPLPPKGLVGKYVKHNRNNRGDLALVGVTVIAYPDATTNSGYRFKVALSAVAPTPLMADEVEVILAEDVGPEAFEKAAAAAMTTAKPIDDVRSSARYRKHMVRNLTRQALECVWDEFAA